VKRREQGDFCLGKNVLRLEVAWNILGIYKELREKHFENVSVLLDYYPEMTCL
jgi:hypothetical protein